MVLPPWQQPRDAPTPRIRGGRAQGSCRDRGIPGLSRGSAGAAAASAGPGHNIGFIPSPYSKKINGAGGGGPNSPPAAAA